MYISERYFVRTALAFAAALLITDSSDILLAKPIDPVKVEVSGPPAPVQDCLLPAEFKLTVAVTSRRNIEAARIEFCPPEGTYLLRGERTCNARLLAGETHLYEYVLKVNSPGQYRAVARVSFGAAGTRFVSSGVYLIDVPASREIETEPERLSPLRYGKKAEQAGAAYNGSFSVRASFRYTDPAGREYPIPAARVQVLEYDESGGNPVVLAEDYTDADGNFSALIADNNDPDGSGRDLGLKLETVDKENRVEVTAPNLQVYTIETPVRFDLDSNDIVNKELDFGNVYPQDDVAGACSIYYWILKGAEYIGDVSGHKPKKVKARWKPGYQTETSYSNDLIEVQSKLSDQDEWDAGIILHEYGHHVMFSSYGFNVDNHCRGAHEIDQPAVGPGQIAVNLAWSEAWAHFFSCAVRNEPTIKDSKAGGVTVYNFEDTGNVYGNDIELAVAGALWDIFDANNESSDQDSVTQGIQNIWNVVKNYDPAPDDAEQSNVWTIQDFWTGWQDLGYPDQTGIKNIFASHGLAVLCEPEPNDYLVSDQPKISWVKRANSQVTLEYSENIDFAGSREITNLIGNSYSFDTTLERGKRFYVRIYTVDSTGRYFDTATHKAYPSVELGNTDRTYYPMANPLGNRYFETANVQISKILVGGRNVTKNMTATIYSTNPSVSFYFTDDPDLATVTLKLYENLGEAVYNLKDTLIGPGEAAAYYDPANKILTYDFVNALQDGNWQLKLEALDKAGQDILPCTLEIAKKTQFTLTNSYNYPNPFNPEVNPTTIHFSLGKPALVDIHIFDDSGQLVRVVQEGTWGNIDSNLILWDGKNDRGHTVSNGVYTLRIVAVNPLNNETATSYHKIGVVR